MESSQEPTDLVTNTSSQPFRLLDLPQEIQDKIYGHYHGRYDLKLKSKQSVTPDGTSIFEPVVGYEQDHINLELACRKVRQDSSKVRQGCYSGVLRLEEWKKAINLAIRQLEKHVMGSFIISSTKNLIVERYSPDFSSSVCSGGLGPATNVLSAMTELDIQLPRDYY